MPGKLKPIKLQTLGPGTHADGGGLYLNVEKSGSRSWLLRVTIDGKRHWLGLGALKLVPLEKARVDAVNLRARARNGENLIEARRKEKRDGSIPTFEAAAAIVHEKISETFDSEKHAHNWLHQIEKHVPPAFRQKAVDKIDPADVLAAIGPIWTTKADTAGRILRRIKAVFDWTIVSGYRASNPCEAIRAALPKQNKKPSHHESLPHKDLPEFIQKLRVSKSALTVKLAFEFLILTASRTNEVLGVTWEEIDLKDAVWIIPAIRMKMKEPHKVPLSARAVEILTIAKQFNDGAIVFPGRYAGHPLSNMAFLMALRRMEYADLTAHGFRATFKTWAEEKTNFDTLVIEASMAHQVKGIERHYLRTTFFDERKKLMNAWAKFATSTPTAKVVSIRA